MKGKAAKRLLSILLSSAMVLGGIQIPAVTTEASGYVWNAQKSQSGYNKLALEEGIPEGGEATGARNGVVADTQETTGEAGGSQGWYYMAVDGNPDTYWHSNFNNINTPELNEDGTIKNHNTITLTLKEAQKVYGVTWLPRQRGLNEGIGNGIVTKFNVQVQKEGSEDWEDVVLADESLNGDGWTWEITGSGDGARWTSKEAQQEREVLFTEPEENVKRVKYVITKTTGQNTARAFITAAELSVLGAKEVVSRGLVGYYTFDDEAGESYANTITGENALAAAAITGVTASEDAVTGKSASFENTDTNQKYLTIPACYTPSAETTIAFWMKAGAHMDTIVTSGVSIFHDVNSDGTERAVLTYAGDNSGNRNGTNKIGTYLTQTDFYHTSEANGQVTTDKWYHVAAVSKPTDKTMTFYINGQKTAASPVNITTSHGYLTHTGSDLRIGAHRDSNNSNNYNGLLDNVRVYNRALTDEEVTAIYNDENAVTGIEITASPTRTLYAQGAVIDPAGIIISKIYTDESREELTAQELEAVTYSPVAEDGTVTVTYEGHEATFTVTVGLEQIEEETLKTNAKANSWHTGNSATDGGPQWAFDGNEGTWWHSNYGTTVPGTNIDGHTSEQNPIWIQTGFNAAENISSLLYASRTGSNNRINRYRILAAKMDNPAETPQDSDFALVGEGSLQDTTNEQTIWLDGDNGVSYSVEATHIRLQALTVYGANTYVTARKMEVYSALSPSEDTIRHIVNTPVTVKENCEEMGTVSLDYSKVVEGVDTAVTATAVVSDRNQYRFVGWEDADGNIVSREKTTTFEINTSSDTSSYKAVFEVCATPDESSLTNISSETLMQNARANSEQWQVEYTNDGPAEYAFNDNDGNWWHSRYQANNGSEDNPPHDYETNDPYSDSGRVSESNPIWIETGFDAVKNVSKMTYTPRNASQNNINGYQILAAKLEDPNGTPADSDFALVWTGNLEALADAQNIWFDGWNGGSYSVEATHVRLQALSVHSTDKHVAAKKIEVYSADSAAPETVRHIVDTPIMVKEDCAAMGNVSLTYSKVVEGIDTVVTAVAAPVSATQYQFKEWQDENGEQISTEPEYTFTVNTSSNKKYYAVFEEIQYDTKIETEAWKAQMAHGSMAEQGDDNFWYYQIRHNEDGWMNIPAEAFHGDFTPEDETHGTGSWMFGGSPDASPYYYSKITSSQITQNFGSGAEYSAVAYAWKAKDYGFYRAKTAVAIGQTGESFTMEVKHVPALVAGTDGEELLAEASYEQGGSFESRIAEAEQGDLIRFAVTSGWAIDFQPVIEQASANEYAQQYLADLASMNISEEYYTSESLAAYNSAKADLESSLESEEQIVTEKIRLLEDAVDGLETLQTIVYTNPESGEQTLTDADRQVYAHMKNLTIEVLCKYETNTSDTPLFTLTDGQGRYLTAWHTLNPEKSNIGRISIMGSNGLTIMPSEMFWSNNVGGEVGKWHKVTISISKDGWLTGAMDGQGYKGYDIRNTNVNWWPALQSFLTQEWKVEKVLVGQKAAGAQYPSNNPSLTDFNGSMKYVKISSTKINGTTSGVVADAAVTQNNIPDAQIAGEFNTFIEEQTSYAQNPQEQIKYTKESWNNFTSLLNASSSLEHDWEKCNAMEEIQAARDALVLASDNVETQYWDKEVILGTIAQQDDSDVWKYQILHDSTWEDLAAEDFKSGQDTENGGIWLTDGNTTGNYHYAAIGRSKLTPCFGDALKDHYHAVAYAWKAPKEGHVEMYFVEKNPRLGVANKDNMDVEILQGDTDVLAKVKLTADASEINKDIFAGYAAVDEGDYLRIAAFTANNDLLDVEPCVKYYDSSKEWAQSYLTRVNAMTWAENTYTKASVGAFNDAKADLQEDVGNNEDDFTYEEDVANMERAMLGLTPYVAAQSLTVTSDLGDGVLDRKDQTAALTVTVSPETATDPLSYTWDWEVQDADKNVVGVTPNEGGKSAVLDVKVRGTYTVTVTVTGEKQTGESLTASCTVNIANLPLIATAGVIGNKGGTLTVSAAPEEEGGQTAQIERDGTAYYKAAPEEGYVIAGWYEDESGSQKLEVEGPELQVTPVTENIQRYVKFTADKSALAALIAQCQAITEEASYMADSWTQLQNAIQAAENVYNNEEASAEEVNNAKENLENAKNALVEYKPVTQAQLQEELTIEGPVGTTGTLQVTVTPEDASNLTYSWTVTGEQIVTLDSTDSATVTLTSVTEGTTTVQVTVTSNNGGSESTTLTKECQVTVKIPQAGVDKTSLEAAKAEAEKIRSGAEYENSYTKESRELLDEALTEAERVLNSNEATEDEVRKATESLKSAMDALERQYKIEVAAPGTITEGGASETETANMTYAKLVDKIVVTAPAEDNGHKFVCWMLQVDGKEAKSVGYAPTYKFYVIGSMKLTPIYEEEANMPEIKPEVMTTASYNKATKKATFTVKRSLPLEGYTVVGHGVILTDDIGKAHYDSSDNEDKFELGATYRIKSSKGSTKGLNGTYSASMSCSRNATWYAKGYVQYKKDGSDDVLIVYSDICEITISGFAQ